jgi:acyl-CoA synthetase (AMP-forming)/AMP-acid ligase II
MFISGGENVYPTEIEKILYQIPQISEVAVIGIPDDKWGEVGKVFVSLKPNELLNETDILNFLSDKIARYKIPKFIQFMENLPRNAAGKILKTELRKFA